MGYKAYIRGIQSGAQHKQMIQNELMKLGQFWDDIDIKITSGRTLHATLNFKRDKDRKNLIQNQNNLPFKCSKIYTEAMCYQCDDKGICCLYRDCEEHKGFKQDGNRSKQQAICKPSIPKQQNMEPEKAIKRPNNFGSEKQSITVKMPEVIQKKEEPSQIDIIQITLINGEKLRIQKDRVANIVSFESETKTVLYQKNEEKAPKKKKIAPKTTITNKIIEANYPKPQKTEMQVQRALPGMKKINQSFSTIQNKSRDDMSQFQIDLETEDILSETSDYYIPADNTSFLSKK